MGKGQAVIVGGGVIGAACAYFLARAGWKVTILEKGKFGKGCSHGNCGFVCPSHVLPLAGPGVLQQTLGSLWAADSPFYIKPRFDPALWSWLWQFARRCNYRDMMESGRAIQALLQSSRTLFDGLVQEENLDCEWQTRGMLFILRTNQGMEHFAHIARMLEKSFQVGSTRFEGEALNRLEPALKSGLAGGWLFPSDAHLRPDKLMTSWKKVLEKKGVTIREHCEAKEFRRTGFPSRPNQASAVITFQGEIEAEVFVVAAGAWTPFLNSALGCRIPIQPGKGYSLTMPRPARCPQYPLIFEEHRVAVTPMQSGYRLGSTMEFSGYDASLNRRRLDYLKTAAALYLQDPFCEPIQEEWFGWRPMTYDSKPILDRSPILSNVWIAAGHNMLGLSMSPASGKLMAELISGDHPHIDPVPFSLRRFS